MLWVGRYSLLWKLVEKNLRVLASERDARRNQGRLKLDASSLGEQFRKELTHFVRVAQKDAKLVAVTTLATRVRPDQTPEQQMSALSSAIFFMPFITAKDLIDAYARYNQIIREVATDTGARLIDGEDTILGDGTHFTDSVHFTDAGSRAMAERVSRALIRGLAGQNVVGTVTPSSRDTRPGRTHGG